MGVLLLYDLCNSFVIKFYNKHGTLKDVVKKDLDNIKRSFGLSDFKKHENYQESARTWIEEWKNSDSNPILFHKFQGIANLGHETTNS